MRDFIKILFVILCFSNGFAQKNITQVEYFLDTDLGVGLNNIVNISEGEDITEILTAAIPISTMIGYHKLYFRIKDANNIWSQTVRKNIQILKADVQNNILLGEYFLDSDPSNTLGVSFEINPNTTDIIQDFIAQIPSDIDLGYHKLYGRVKDLKNNWSFTFRKNIQVIENENINIIELEYFFGNDLQFGNNTSVVVNSPQTDGIWNFYISYPTGPYNFNDVLFLRAKDSNNKWSQTTILDEIDASLHVAKLTTDNPIKIFPNPVKDILIISSKKQFKIAHLTVYNLLGKEVLSSSYNLKTIDLSGLSSGIYILNVKSDIGFFQFKIIKL